MIELNTQNFVDIHVKTNYDDNVYQNLCDNFTYDVRFYVSDNVAEIARYNVYVNPLNNVWLYLKNHTEQIW